MTKLFLFDLGKVLVDFDFSIAIKRLKSLTSVNMLKVRSLFANSGLAKNWDRGLLPPEQFFDAIQKEMNFPIQMKEFISIWNEIFSEDKDMISLIKRLNQNHQVMILSNTNPWHAEYIRKTFPWVSELDGFIASCDVRLLKPDPEIFKLVLKKARAQASETFYVDDISENVRAAKTLGMEAYLFKNFSDVHNKLKKKDILLD